MSMACFQVRNMMAVLFHVGRGLEEPSLVGKLLDVSTMPGKPQYTMSPDQPLLLYHAAYDSDDLRMQYSASTLPHTLPWHAGSGGIVVCLLVLTRATLSESLATTVSTLEAQWSELTMKAAMIRNCLDTVRDFPVSSGANAIANAAKNLRTRVEGDGAATLARIQALEAAPPVTWGQVSDELQLDVNVEYPVLGRYKPVLDRKRGGECAALACACQYVGLAALTIVDGCGVCGLCWLQSRTR